MQVHKVSQVWYHGRRCSYVPIKFKVLSLVTYLVHLWPRVVRKSTFDALYLVRRQDNYISGKIANNPASGEQVLPKVILF